MVRRARGMRKTVHSPEQRAFCELMVAARKKKPGLTQQKLAEELGKPQSFVAKYERGDRRVDVTEFITICQALGTDPIRVLKSLIRRFP